MTEAAKPTKKAFNFSGIVKYFKEVKAEIKKVVWPTPKQITNNTLVVIASIIIIGIVIWIVDSGLGFGLRTIINK